MLVSLIFLFNTLAFVQGQVTVHHQVGFGYPAPAATSPAAYNNTRLIPPAIPNPAPANSFTLTLQQDSALVGGLSIPHVGGSFWGFSIEMSVISQIRKSNFLLDLLSFFLKKKQPFLCFSWKKLVCSS